MNFANCRLVTSVTSIQKAFNRTRCIGRSSARASESTLPIEKSPAGIKTMPTGAGCVEIGAGIGAGAAQDGREKIVAEMSNHADG
jgi:hypothetical protein